MCIIRARVCVRVLVLVFSHYSLTSVLLNVMYLYVYLSIYYLVGLMDLRNYLYIYLSLAELYP